MTVSICNCITLQANSDNLQFALVARIFILYSAGCCLYGTSMTIFAVAGAHMFL